MANEPRLAVESIAGQRPYQEDSVFAENLSDGRVLVAVADGMGGHAAGEVASALALETLVAAVEDGEDLDVAVTLANTRVHEMAREPGKQGMGTTLVVALIEDGEFIIANVGDSRGYLLSGDGIRQITDDHSFVAEAVKRGQSEEEAMATPWKDALTRSIGTEEHVEVDVFGPFPVRDDMALLICSDGLYKTLSDDDLQRIFRRSGGPRGAAQSLVSSALESGSDDNISVVIAEYGEVPREVAQGTMPLSYVPDPELDVELGSAQSDGGEDDDASSGEETHDADVRVDDTPRDESASDPLGGTDPATGSTGELETKDGPPIPMRIVAAVVAVGALIAYLVFGP